MKLTFGNNAVSYDAATQHFAFVGATGSGKTILIRLLMQSVLGNATKRSVPTRMLIYDSKRDMLPVLHGIFERLKRTDAEERIKLLNPFDKRGVAWDLAQDITEPAHAQELASILIREEPNAKDPFYPNAARLIVENVILSFIENNPLQWTFRDVCNAVETKKSIASVLGRTSRTRWVIDALFGDDRTTANIMATIAAAMRPYRVIAALWHKAVEADPPRKISLHEWAQSKEAILVLGNSPTSRTAVDAINQVLFKRLSQMFLEEKEEIDLENDPRRVWVILDEFVRAGRLNGAVELATEGRSKGVSLVLGFQDVNGLRAVYGKEVAEEILGQCTSVALLRMNSPDTSEWASRIVGQYRGKDTKVSASEGYQAGKDRSSSGGTNTEQQIVDRLSLLPSHFQRLRPISKLRKQGLSGVFCSPYWTSEELVNEVYSAEDEPISYDWLFTDKNVWPKSEMAEAKGFDRSEGEDQYLDEWKPEDFTRLKLIPEAERKDAQAPEDDKQKQGTFGRIKAELQNRGFRL